jgi:hypothetical protein
MPLATLDELLEISSWRFSIQEFDASEVVMSALASPLVWHSLLSRYSSIVWDEHLESPLVTNQIHDGNKKMAVQASRSSDERLGIPIGMAQSLDPVCQLKTACLHGHLLESDLASERSLSLHAGPMTK